MEPNSEEERKSFQEHSRRSTTTPFLLKTYRLVEDPATDGVISWNENGTGFVVWQPAEFARDILPTIFKHCNFSSFVRQLNTYGFRKVATARWEFYNDMFRRGESELLCNIIRRKSWPNKNCKSTNYNQSEPHDHHHNHEENQRSPSTSSSSGYNVLVDENKRLKKENGFLSLELRNAKRKCKKLLDLVGTLGNNVIEKNDDGGDDDDNDDNGDGDDDEKRPKLFGVRLEVEGERRKKGEPRRYW